MKKIILSILIMLVIFIMGCTQSVEETSDDAAGMKLTIEGHPEDQSTGEVKEFDIIARNWEFIPETITVNEGDMVELNIKSIDVTHGFLLPDFGVDEKLEPNRDVHISFVADKKGTFGFYCSVPCGAGHGGMRGELIVN
ncbi:cupredoxin domain-containing protein [Candidatus Woesearchaeota archaeon]|nr:cupredoxin domain-containing protein [Candidatus Woesearchaeota archaeon]